MSAEYLNHNQARETIVRQGNNLELTLQRFIEVFFEFTKRTLNFTLFFSAFLFNLLFGFLIFWLNLACLNLQRWCAQIRRLSNELSILSASTHDSWKSWNQSQTFASSMFYYWTSFNCLNEIARFKLKQRLDCKWAKTKLS